ncbi:S-adenosyl-L-methionine-dependent methyltransferase, partial [Sphaerosporella brunnea]
SSSASSIARSHSELANYRIENNRRYQSFREGKWILPNDEREQDRYQIVDQMVSLVLNGDLHKSPMEQPKRILDLGTGTGVWAIDIAHKFPNCRVIGTDLSPIQVPAPPNCTFEIEDADEEWVYPPNYFSMVHTRHVMPGIADWYRFFEQSYRVLHPGGWVELHEAPHRIYSDNPNTPSDIPLMRVCQRFSDYHASMGKPCGEEVFEFKDHLEAVGFVDVTETRYRIPLGAWRGDPIEREIGRYNLLNVLEALEAYTLALHDLGLDDLEEARDLARKAENNAKNRKLELYCYLVVIRGRKPTACEALPNVPRA